MLPGMWDDDVVVLAGSPHAHVRACWIPARPCPCPLDPRTHTLTAYACTHTLGPCMHAPGPCTHAPGPCTHAPGPCTLARTGSPHPLAHRAHLTYSHRVPMPAWSPCTHRVPMPACSQGPHASTHWAMHARSHRAMHVCSHRAPMPAQSPCTHAPGPCTHTRTGTPHALARRVPMHMYICPLDASCMHPSAVYREGCM